MYVHGPCAFCDQLTVNAIDSIVDVTAKNNQIVAAKNKEVEEWNDNGQQGPKPKLKGNQLEKLRNACFARWLTCALNPDGVGCFQCTALVEAGQPLPRQTDSHGRLFCSCPICQSLDLVGLSLGGFVKLETPLDGRFSHLSVAGIVARKSESSAHGPGAITDDLVHFIVVGMETISSTID